MPWEQAPRPAWGAVPECNTGNPLSAPRVVSERIEGEAWDISVKYADHELSFTDCTGAVIARELGLVVWAYDRDFATLGFQLIG